MLQTESKVRERLILNVRQDVIQPSLFSAKNVRFSLIISSIYLLVSYFLLGFKGEQLVLVFLFNSLYFASNTTRRLVTGFSIFIIYWIIFDYMKAFPNYRFNTVHIASLYNLEKEFFGVHWNNSILTPNEFFALNHNTALDLMTGVFYLCWIPVPLLFAGIIFFKNRKYFFYFSLTFFLVNLLGFIGYYAYPAAPPWYVAQHGFNFIAATPGNTGGLARFDSYFGIKLFEGMYSKSSNVFAAMPSMHAAFMLIVLYYGIKSGLKGWNFLFGIVMVGIWFSAVYTSHHYILDIIAGIACAFLAIFLLQRFIQRTKQGNKLLQNLLALTSR